MYRLLGAAALVFLCALPSAAQQLSLQIDDGRVTLDAVNVPARQILDEWARVGGTKVVGADKIPAAPLTLRLVDTPERLALDIILRNVAGFMAAPRQASSAPGASAYDRILVMATTSVPPPAPARPPGNTVQRRVPPRPPNLPPSLGDEPAEEPMIADDQADVDPNAQPVFTFPQPQGAPANPVYVPMPGGQPAFGAPGNAPPVITLQPGPNGPTIYNFVPSDGTQQQQPPQNQPPTTGFGVFGAQTPGMIQMPQPQPGQPVPVPPPTRRPPG